MRIALAEKALNVDVITQDLAGRGQAAIERDLGVEQSIDGEAARAEVDAEPGRQKEVGLPRFDGDASGHAAAVEIPGAVAHVMFRDDAAGSKR